MAKSSAENALEGLTTTTKGRAFTTSQNRPAVLSGMDNALKEPKDVEQWPVDKLREHPDNSRYFQPLTGADFEALKADIKAHGMHDALIVTAKNDKGERTVLSGHNRLRAVKALKAEEKENSGKWDKVSIREKGFTSKDAEKGFVIRDNLLRRQLDTEQKAMLINQLLKDSPEMSDRAIAHILKVDHKTVASKRDKLETGGEIPHLKTRTGKDGKKQTANKPKRPEKPENRGKTGFQTVQEAPQRTQKGGAGERVGDAGAELLTLTVDYLKKARALRGLRRADVDKALEKIQTLYNVCE